MKAKVKKKGPELPGGTPIRPTAKTTVKKTTVKPAPKKEYDSYIDFFKGNNTYKKGTKSVKMKKSC